jgi:GWxTD domain-containing protein
MAGSNLWRFLVCAVGLLLAASPAFTRGQSGSPTDDRLIREEQEDYFQKWLSQDVVYIISPEERDVFRNLTTPEEKEQFIEQFWFRRDPDPRTSFNEFKEEHYRRIAYSNETFASGEPGWMTDRGRIYIIHGPPDQIEARPAGGVYDRPMREGGGSTSTYPFEVWWYRYLPGVGSDIELEFVDRNGGNQYRLVMDYNYKDVLLHVNNAGKTMAEELGIARREDRPFFSPQNQGRYPFMWQRAKDDPFLKYETFAAVKRPPEIKFKDLQEIVKVDLHYDNLPFEVRQDFFRLDDRQLLVPVTVQLDNRLLTFREGERGHTARLAVYGIVTSLQNRVVSEFEDEVTSRFRSDDFEQGRLGRSLYQKVVVLERNNRYKIDLVVKDLESGKVGAVRQAIIPPSFPAESLSASSLLLSDFIEDVGDFAAKDDRMFVLGDVWIRPSLSKVFPLNQSLGVYFQVYNFGLDQTSFAPDLAADYRVFRDDRLVLEVSDEAGESIQLVSSGRLVLVRRLQVNLLDPGRYRLEVRVRDAIKGEELVVNDRFELVSATG